MGATGHHRGRGGVLDTGKISTGGARITSAILSHTRERSPWFLPAKSPVVTYMVLTLSAVVAWMARPPS